jgi:O-antigen/teichoic acid export membrane protein
VEIAAYNLLVLAFYSLWRLAQVQRSRGAGEHSPLHLRPPAPLLTRLVAQLAAMVALGFALGAVQLIPLYELVRTSFRQGSVSYSDVIGWAYPWRQLLAFVMPDVFGNPSHHTYLDVLDGTVQAVTRNFAGQPLDTIFWGVKNYVEGTAYVGILPLLLALLSVLGYLAERLAIRRARVGRLSIAATSGGRYRNLPYGTEGREEGALPLSVSERGLGGEVEAPLPAHGGGTWWGLTPLFATLAVLSLLFAFGTPLYALLFFGLPGFNQLHTPFRWIYPYTLSLAVLAGIGANLLVERWRGSATTGGQSRLVTWLGGGALLAGLGGLLAVLASYALRTHTVALADRLLQRSASLQNAFASGRMLYSYEVRNLASFALLLALAGAVVALGRRENGKWKMEKNFEFRISNFEFPSSILHLPFSVWPLLAVALLLVDLFAFGLGFNPAADPKLLNFTPPAVEFLQQDKSLYRIFSFRSDKLLNANSAWLFGLQDARGYDSIIPKQYADFMSLLEDQRGFLLNNRIGDVYNVATLASPLLDLLNVKYVLSETPFDLPGYTLVYDGELKMSLRAQRSNLLIYRHDDALPRAFAVYQARVLDRSDWAHFAAELQSLKPRETVLLEETPASLPPGQEPCLKCLERAGNEVRRIDYTPNQVTIQVLMADNGFLVLGDSYFPGWLATVDGQESKIYRADGNFRAVAVPAGEHKVIFKYSPLSFRLGLFTSTMAAIAVLLALGALAWRRFYRESEQDHAVRRVAKNTLTQIGAQLMNRLIDMLFAMLVLRLLGPAGQGKYALAIAFIGYFDILTNFGLNTLLTREVAKDRSQANRYLANTTILRLLLWLGSLPIIAAGIGLYMAFGGMTRDTALAIGLFALMLVPSNIATALTSVFNAYEKMEYPAAITVVTTLAKVALGALALFLGWGFVGLAGMSILVSTITAILLFILLYVNFWRPRPEFDGRASRWMLGESYPLMINHLLASVFFRIDAVILPWISGPEANGYYTAAYKFIDGLNIIPAYLTLAIFPVLSRYAESARDTLMRAYVLSLRVLLIIALPITVGTTLIAPQIMELFGGRQYLPYSAQALAVLIWFLPFSYINSVTQYVLIAVNQQRFLTVAFLIGATFNIVANLLLIPRYSFMGAATVTVLSEIVLFAPFYYSVRKNVGALPWWRIVWQPALASAIMGGVTWWLLPQLHVLLVIALAAVVYFAGLLALGTITAEDVALARKLVSSPKSVVRGP